MKLNKDRAKLYVEARLDSTNVRYSLRVIASQDGAEWTVTDLFRRLHMDISHRGYGIENASRADRAQEDVASSLRAAGWKASTR